MRSADGTPDAAEVLTGCIDSGRVDILRSSLGLLEREGRAAEVLNALCTADGTLLHHACRLGSVDSMRTLLAADCDPSVANEDGCTAFDLARTEDSKRVFAQCLLQAIAQNRFDRVGQLLSAGFPVNMPDSPYTGNTALHWAAMYAGPTMARYLVDNGASLNAKNTGGDTPLHLAIKRGDADMVSCFAELGSDWCIENEEGYDSIRLVNGNQALRSLCRISNGAIEQTTNSEIPETDGSVSADNDVSENGTVVANALSKIVEIGNAEKEVDMTEGDEWYRLLWPQPKQLYVVNMEPNPTFAFPERKLRVYFFANSHCKSTEIVTIWQVLNSLWKTLNVEIEFRHDVINGRFEFEPSSVVCGVFPRRFGRAESYELAMSDKVIELVASDLSAIGYGIHMLIQMVRLCLMDRESALPLVRLRDWPSERVRALLLDFSGCRVYTAETIGQIAVRMAHMKASHLMVGFEVRITDKFALPFQKQQLFDIAKVCQSLRVNFVPSLDLNSCEVDTADLCNIVGQFCDAFQDAREMLVGPFLGQALLKHFCAMSWLFTRYECIFWALKDLAKLEEMSSALPPHCVLVIDAEQVSGPETVSDLNGLQHAVCFAVRTCPVGYFCQDVNSLASASKRLIRLMSAQANCLGVLVCDYATGSEIVPHCLSFVPTVTALGIAWNGQAELHRYFAALPSIAADHLTNSRQMSLLFECILQAAHVEHSLSKAMGESKAALSVFAQILLNPDCLDLDNFSPVAFKKSRIELQRCLDRLETTKKAMPYNFELALCVAEVQLVLELMILGARMAQALCVVGTNPSSDCGLSIANFGLSNLSATTRTDLANRLLEIRARFQSAWLSRNVASTLNSALKMFDNLFRNLLPPSLQAFGENLL